jgi:hypothetical protein
VFNPNTYVPPKSFQETGLLIVGELVRLRAQLDGRGSDQSKVALPGFFCKPLFLGARVAIRIRV